MIGEKLSLGKLLSSSIEWNSREDHFPQTLLPRTQKFIKPKPLENPRVVLACLIPFPALSCLILQQNSVSLTFVLISCNFLDPEARNHFEYRPSEI